MFPPAAMWTMMASGADVFTESYNTAGGNSTVVRLPEEGITGNSHFHVPGIEQRCDCRPYRNLDSGKYIRISCLQM